MLLHQCLFGRPTLFQTQFWRASCRPAVRRNLLSPYDIGSFYHPQKPWRYGFPDPASFYPFHSTSNTSAMGPSMMPSPWLSQVMRKAPPRTVILSRSPFTSLRVNSAEAKMAVPGAGRLRGRRAAAKRYVNLSARPCTRMAAPTAGERLLFKPLHDGDAVGVQAAD